MKTPVRRDSRHQGVGNDGAFVSFGFVCVAHCTQLFLRREEHFQFRLARLSVPGQRQCVPDLSFAVASFANENETGGRASSLCGIKDRLLLLAVAICSLRFRPCRRKNLALCRCWHRARLPVESPQKEVSSGGDFFSFGKTLMAVATLPLDWLIVLSHGSDSGVPAQSSDSVRTYRQYLRQI